MDTTNTETRFTAIFKLTKFHNSILKRLKSNMSSRFTCKTSNLFLHFMMMIIFTFLDKFSFI
jgi:hypothetical protein